jgi:protein-S-isoprenylcysteine O-methyltransferase Ste14
MIRQLWGAVAYVALFAVLLALGAGTWRWPAAWVLLATLLVTRGASDARLWRVQRGLMEERAGVPLRRGQPAADRVLIVAFMATYAALVVVSAADVWRMHLLPAPPAWLRAAGLAAFIAGWWIVHRALETNAFAAFVVRHQADRGQVVVSDGPYAVVRHPMYAGLVPVLLGFTLWLGSTAALILTAVPVAILAARIRVEERMLRAELPGYPEYAARVRWRLVPGLW